MLIFVGVTVGVHVVGIILQFIELFSGNQGGDVGLN